MILCELKVKSVCYFKYLVKVCFFGSYPQDPAIALFRQKLEFQNIEVKECHIDINISLEHRSISRVISSYWKLLVKHRKVGEYDIAVLPLWWGAIQLPLLKIISRKPILYFGQGSPYDELVNDRKKIKPTSFTARFFLFFEKMVCRLSDLITKESQAEIAYYTHQMNISKKKFRVLNIGADKTKFPACPFKEFDEKFIVLYWGTFIPLHGVEVIVQAAKILSTHKDILFRFCGEGQTKSEMENFVKKHNLTNTEFLGFVEQSSLLENIKNSDVCLGIFGKSQKAEIVVTHKVYQILCSQKPLITMDSRVIREINLENDKNSILVPKQDPKELAKAILYLKNNENKRKEIAYEGRKIFEEKFSIVVTSKIAVKYLNELLSKK